MVLFDWYHVRKSCTELLSMALQGRAMRHMGREKLMPLLWHGLVDEAIKSLQSVPDTQIKNPEEIGHLSSSLTRNRPMIPAYAVRRE